MAPARVPRVLAVVVLAGALWASPSRAGSQGPPRASANDKPPVYQGGLWADDFFNPSQLTNSTGVDISPGLLLLKLVETLEWTQTWTAHFATGSFDHTEAISDSVRLAPNGPGQFFTTGVYTSTVFDAGRAVDWTAGYWAFSGDRTVSVEFRAGAVPLPDDSWSAWIHPGSSLFGTICANVVDTNQSECNSNMGGLDSRRYLQYRATFSSGDPATTVQLDEVRVTFGLHPAIGQSESLVITPIDLGAWRRVVLTATVPAATALVIDVLAPDGTVVMPNVNSGADLTGLTQPGLRLRATLTTTDPALTPELDYWALVWEVRRHLYLPAIGR